MQIPANTTAYRLINGAGSGRPGLYVDYLGPVILIQSDQRPDSGLVQSLAQQFPGRGIYYKHLTRHVRRTDKPEASPHWMCGPRVAGRFPILENGLTFLLSMESGYSTGLFLDQRENRRNILEMDLQGKMVLNTFAYTCAFSVCAAKAGATVTSLDLSKKYLDWGRENFRANLLDDTAHDFIFGDVFGWLPRLTKRGRRWDVIILDPPTFSTNKTGRAFKIEEDYPRLITLARTALAPGGKILACLNAHDVSVQTFRKLTGIPKILPLPADFPTAAGSEPYLKAGWVQWAPTG